MLADVQPGTHKNHLPYSDAIAAHPLWREQRGPPRAIDKIGIVSVVASVALVGVAEGIAGSRKKV